MPAVTLVDFCPSYPETDAERKTIAFKWLERLSEEWFNQDLPGDVEVFHVLVHRPGEIASDPLRARHIGDESEARAEETGLTPVAVTLTDVISGAEDYEVWRIRRDQPSSGP
jgi:hypothetical protein